MEKKTTKWLGESTLFRNGDKLLSGNCIGIGLRTGFNEYAKNMIRKHQTAFRYNRSVNDELFTLKEIQTSSYEHKDTLFVIFVDVMKFQKAYDKKN